MGHREFVQWLAYEDLEFKHMTKQDYYMAQISQMIAKTAGNDCNISDFRIEFIERTPDDELLYPAGE